MSSLAYTVRIAGRLTAIHMALGKLKSPLPVRILDLCDQWIHTTSRRQPDGAPEPHPSK